MFNLKKYFQKRSKINISPHTLLENYVLNPKVKIWILVLGTFVLVFGLLTIFSAIGTDWSQFQRTNLRLNFLIPVLVSYVFIIQPFIFKLRNKAIKAFNEISHIPDRDFANIITHAPSFNRTKESLAVGIGIIFGFVILPPWEMGNISLNIYTTIITALFFGIIGWFIYSALAGTALFTGLQRKPMQMNLFDDSALHPVTNWSMGVSLSLIGFITLASFLIPPADLSGKETIITFGVITLVAILVFFLNLYVTHRVIRKAKKQELKMLRLNLDKKYTSLKKGLNSKIRKIDNNTIQSLYTYERRIKEVPEWPYSIDVIRNLIISVLLPSTIWIFRLLAIKQYL